MVMIVIIWRRAVLATFLFIPTAAAAGAIFAAGRSGTYGGDVGAVSGAAEAVRAAGTGVASVVRGRDQGDRFRMDDGAACAGAGAF